MDCGTDVRVFTNHLHSRNAAIRNIWGYIGLRRMPCHQRSTETGTPSTSCHYGKQRDNTARRRRRRRRCGEHSRSASSPSHRSWQTGKSCPSWMLSLTASSLGYPSHILTWKSVDLIDSGFPVSYGVFQQHYTSSASAQGLHGDLNSTGVIGTTLNVRDLTHGLNFSHLTA